MSHFLLFRGRRTGEASGAISSVLPGHQTQTGGGHVLALDGPNASGRVSAETGWARVAVLPDPAEGGPSLPDLDGAGHFAHVVWGTKGVDGLTDRQGLRSIYVARWLDGWLFGTHLQTVARLSGNSRPDPTAFGSHWLLQNQIGRESLVRGISRICASAFRLDGNTLHQTDHPPFARQPVDPAEALRKYLGGPTTLGLSGGLDSRLLLALAPEGQALHTFGDSLDAQVAARIAATLSLPLRVIDTELPEVHLLLGQLRTNGNQCSTPASFLGRSDGFSRALSDGRSLIDGGFGEFGRRVFMGRLVRLGRFRPIGPTEAFRALRFGRGDFFRKEVLMELERRAMESIRASIPSRPDGIWADTMGLQHRLPNFFGYEQERLDGLGSAFMPFAQPDVLAAIQALEPRRRAGGRWFRSIIRTERPELARLPLVKGSKTYPFGLGPLGAQMWTRFVARAQPQESDQSGFLNRAMPYLQDRIRDTGLHEWFDRGLLTAAIERHAKGDVSVAPALDWWLALDGWLEGLKG